MLLETYSTLSVEELESRLPSFLRVVGNVTGQAEYSMYNLSLHDEWDGHNFCRGLPGKADAAAEPPPPPAGDHGGASVAPATNSGPADATDGRRGD